MKTQTRGLLAQQQAHIESLESQLNDSQSQRIRPIAKLEKMESEKQRTSQELRRVQLQAERASEAKAKELQQEQKLYTEKLHLANQSIEELSQTNDQLRERIITLSGEKEAARCELYELGKRSADQGKISELEGQIAQMQEDREQSKQQLQDVKQRLADAENRLFIAKDTLSQINQKYLATRKNLAKLDFPKCPQCNTTLRLKRSKFGSGYFWSCPAWQKDGSGCNAKTRSTTATIKDKFSVSVK